MKFPQKIGVLLLLVCGLSSCTMTPEQYAFRQKIPVQLQSGVPLTFKIKSLSGNGVNDIGIQCTPDVWNNLTNGSKNFEVRLLHSNRSTTEIGGIGPGAGSHFFLGMVTNVHYLFYVSGEYHSSATVEIKFPNSSAGVTHAQIMVGKTAADTGS